MKRLVKGALLAAGTALAISAAPAMPAAAATSGTETLSGTIVFVAVPGTNTRTVIGSVVRARGVFRGVGRVVELVPPDPARCQPGRSGLPRRHHARGQHAREAVVILGQPAQLPVHRDAAAYLGRDRRHRAVRRRDRQRHRDGQRRGAFGPQPRRQLLVDAIACPRHEVDKFAESGTLSF